jgi:hypothetical protein
VILDASVANNHVRLGGENGSDERRDVVGSVLVVGVGVHDDVRAELQGGIDPRLKRHSESLIGVEADDVIDTALARHLGSAVGRAVVDDEPLHRVESSHLARKSGEGDRQDSFFVETRYLDDQLHRRVGIPARLAWSLGLPRRELAFSGERGAAAFHARCRDCAGRG